MPRTWLPGWTRWIVLVAVAAAGLVVLRTVELAPRVEAEFFFAEDDPQLRSTLEIAERFPSAPQVIVRVAGADEAPPDPEAVRELTDRLAVTPGVVGVRSPSRDDLRSPLWSRLLTSPTTDAVNLIVQVDGPDGEVLLDALEGAVAEALIDAGGAGVGGTGPGPRVSLSGVPVIVERIRRALARDLRVFSLAALLVFGVLLVVVFRSLSVVAGAFTAAAAACALTLVAIHLLGIRIGLLSANLITIVFVLTLSHVVFLTVNWRGAVRRGEDPPSPGTDEEEAVPQALEAVEGAVLRTRTASLWAMLTTLLGFLSLLVASARPLREFGVAGALGTVAAFVAAFSIMPTFLAGASAPSQRRGAVRWRPIPGVVWSFALAVVLLGLGLFRLDTDPGLLTYFAPGREPREGLEAVDRDGGSSSLDVVVRDPEGRLISEQPVYDALWRLQDSLEADPAVGVVLSPAVLLEHARIQPLAGFLSRAALLELLDTQLAGEVGRGFSSPDRTEARFMLRMREGAREAPRAVVADRIRSLVEQAGLGVTGWGGFWDLQQRLAELIASSLRIGLGGLLLLFAGIAFLVAGSARVALAMWLCLAAIPVVVLGAFGLLGVSLDIVTSPAANVSMAMGVDAMIHLSLRARSTVRDPAREVGTGAAWWEAVRDLGPAVVTTTLLLTLGFGIFAVSEFPPTRRFGLAVALGTVTAAVAALAVLPELAGRWVATDDAVSGPGEAGEAGEAGEPG